MLKTSKIKTLTFFLVFISFLASTINVKAEIKDLTALNIDGSIVTKDTTGYGDPVKILVTPVYVNNGTEVNSEKWIRGVYYYTIDKLGFQDIPFHYLVTSEGLAVRTNSLGDEKKVNIDGIGNDMVVVGYLTSKEAGSFEPASIQALTDLLIDISNQNAIKPEKIIMNGIEFVKDSSTNTISIQKTKISSSWADSLKSIIKNVSKKYAPVAKKYSVEVGEIILPTNEITPGEEVSVTLKLKNTGKYGFYPNSNSEIALTKDNGSSSNFYINEKWLSQSQASIMNQDQLLLPGEEKSFEFKIKAPLASGEYSENFIFKTSGGTSIKSNKNIKLTLKLKKTTQQIIEIKTSFDFVNVRSQPYDSATVLRKVTAGERFFLIDLNLDTLWAKIDLGEGQEGYIPAWDLKYI